MKIKTILYDVTDAKEFDNAVNEALAQGWTLVKRGFIPGAATSTAAVSPILYAELVLEPCCDNCKHEACDPDDPSTPCHHCEHDEMWEARRP